MSTAVGTGYDPWSLVLVVVLAVHAGFQAVVTTLVYPALAEVPPARWRTAHARHSRRITPLVVVVYGGVLVGCAGTLVHGDRTAGTWLALVATAGVFLVTAAGAAPLHGRLGHDHDAALLVRLLVVDRARLALAVLALVAAVVALL